MEPGLCNACSSIDNVGIRPPSLSCDVKNHQGTSGVQCPFVPWWRALCNGSSQYLSTVIFCWMLMGMFMPMAPMDPSMSWSTLDFKTRPVLRSISEVPL